VTASPLRCSTSSSLPHPLADSDAAVLHPLATSPAARAGECQAAVPTVRPMDVRIAAVEPSLTAVVVVEPMDLSRFMACYDTVYAFLRGGADVKQTGQNIALYDRGQRMEVGVEVDRSFEPAGLVVSSSLPGGRIAHATHTTGYGDLGKTYDAIGKWCDTNGHETAGIQWEIYSDPDEHDHVDVEICYLLA
jgi:effector-binding domain-containing protein